MTTPTLGKFNTEIRLTEYIDALNERGVTPEISIMDSRGISMLVCLQAPGGDGWGVAYYSVNNGDEGTIEGDENGWVKPTRYLSEYQADWDVKNTWQPMWPVFGIVDAELT